jgi:hypothetical protein
MGEEFIDEAIALPEMAWIRIEMDSRGGGKVLIHEFAALTPGLGHGSKALDALAALADRMEIRLVLFPEADVVAGGLDQASLGAWYARHGFEQTASFGHWERLPKPVPTPNM